MKKSTNIRDFWLLVLFVYAILGFSSVRAQDEGLKKGLTLLNQGNFDEAIVVLRQEVDKNPQEPEGHVALGISYLEKGENSLAQDHLQKAAQLDPNTVTASYTLAMLYEKEQELTKAIEEWKKVLALTKDKDLKELARKHIRHLEQ